MSHATYIEGNLALQMNDSSTQPRFSVIDGGLSSVVDSSSVSKPASKKLTVILAAVLIVFIGSFAAIKLYQTHSVINDMPTVNVVVESGDSLWSVASEYGINGLSTQEVSDVIASVNHLDKTGLEPGQVLKVPAQ